MKKQLQKKFCSRLPVRMAFIVAAIMFSASANAQIVYTDIAPDSTITTTLNTVKKLVFGDTISLSQACHDTTVQYLQRYQQTGTGIPTNTGEWNNAVDGYVGLQLINGGQTVVEK